jgi:hypothetical protein
LFIFPQLLRDRGFYFGGGGSFEFFTVVAEAMDEDPFISGD